MHTRTRKSLNNKGSGVEDLGGTDTGSGGGWARGGGGGQEQAGTVWGTSEKLYAKYLGEDSSSSDRTQSTHRTYLQVNGAYLSISIYVYVST